MDNPLRIALIVNSFPKLSETFIFNKVLGLMQAGMDVTVFTGSQRNDGAAFEDRLSQIQPGQVRHTLLGRGFIGILVGLMQISVTKPLEAAKLIGQSHRLYPKNFRRGLRAWILALPLKLGHFDLIHFEFSGLAVTYLDALPLLKTSKLLTSCRGAAEKIMPVVDPTRGAQLRKVFKYLDLVHCVSSDMEETVREYGRKPEQAFVNHPAIDTELFHREQPYQGKTTGPYRLISVGRLHWKMRLLLNDGYDVLYDIIGGGIEEERLLFMIHDLGLTERVHLHGNQPARQVRQMYEKADICLLPSLSEGMSNVALEAMAMALPIVSTTVGGMAEALTDGVEGFLVPPYQPEIMAEKTALLIDNPELRIQMGKAGRQRVEKDFTLEDQIKKFLSIYQSLSEDQLKSKDE